MNRRASDFVNIYEPIPRNLADACEVCLRKGRSSRGRATRREFWQLFLLLAIVLPATLGGMTARHGVFVLRGTSIMALEFWAALPSVMVFFRRLHDGNSSGTLLYYFYSSYRLRSFL